ncbi:MAG: hypothetical protein H7328_11210 [Bdellovibrio sp.]|nr:hypothetical protein [Bdellovibrio sp.]
MAKFYVSCPVGFEAELAAELKDFWFEMMDLDGQPTRSALPEYDTWPGGIEFETEDHLGYQINFFSKLANRVLIRVAKFEARYFDQLEKELGKFPIEKWLEPQSIKVKVEHHKSRLNHEKNIIEAITNTLGKKKFKIAANTTEGLVIVYFRIDKDRVTISLDTSGDHLHRRGYAQYRGEAPIRENLAAMMVRQLQKKTSIDQNLTVIDPFVGSGTILFEVACYREASLKRDYSWFKFLNRPKLFKSETWSKNYRWFAKSTPAKMIAIDFEESAIENLIKNQALLAEKFPLTQLDIQTYREDSIDFDLKPLAAHKNLWVMTNPPYGHRLEEGDARAIIERFANEAKAAGVIVLHPESWNFKFESLKLSSQLDFKNQGLKLKLSVYSH